MTQIQIEGTSEVPHLLLNRPQQANALNAELLWQLVEAIESVLKGGARAIVLAGKGRGFSAGADLNEVSGTIEDLTIDDRIASVTNTIISAPVPVIAALHGFCFGGAVDVAWSCDLVIATPNMRIGLPAARLGILYNPSALQRLYARLGARTIRRLVLFGEELNGQEAYRIGAIDSLAEPDQHRQTATIAAHSAIKGIPAVVAASKAFFNALDTDHVELDEWQLRRQELLTSRERQAALRRHKRGGKSVNSKE